MHIVKLLEFLALLSVAHGRALPTQSDDVNIEDLPDLDSLPPDILKRGNGKSAGSPKDFIIDMSRNTAAYETFEADCMAILCFGAPNVLLDSPPPSLPPESTQGYLGTYPGF